MKAFLAVFALALVGGASSAKILRSGECSHVIGKRQACTLFQESTEGPYYLEDTPNRVDIREGRLGVTLELTLQVLNYTTCQPMSGLVVDLWNADAYGSYSYFSNNNTDGTSLRGWQTTNSSGYVNFVTIVPAWYSGRTMHLHVNTWLNNQKHVGQFFFEEAVQQVIATLSPYSSSNIQRITNAQDSVYNQFNGEQTLLSLTQSGSGGYSSSMVMGFTR